LDSEIPSPFLRHNDDYLIFCKSARSVEKLLEALILPKLKKLGLEINEKKLRAGKFHQDFLEFLGFKYYAGIFTISEDKIEKFRGEITKITHLINKKPNQAIIKLLNNKILGFGHYYKIVSCKQHFEKLDSFIRERLRRSVSRNKVRCDKQSNLILTNVMLESMKLKSLEKIK